MPETSRQKIVFFIFILILLDQFSKAVVLKFFSASWRIVFNKGISFGFFPSFWWLGVNLVIILIVGRLLKNSLARSLIIGGGLSNILDRIMRRKVVDFIDFKIWPVFNLADVFICLGVGILIFNIAFRPKT